MLQFWKSKTDKLCEIFFASHELLAFTSVGLCPFHDMRGITRLGSATAKLFHENWFASECSSQCACKRNEIRVKWLPRPGCVHWIGMHHGHVGVGEDLVDSQTIISM